MIVIGIFFLGVLVGSVCKKFNLLFKFSDRLTLISLYLLLLFLGISIGNNPKLVANMMQIGIKGLLFAIFASLGSIIAILPLYLIFSSKES